MSLAVCVALLGLTAQTTFANTIITPSVSTSGFGEERINRQIAQWSLQQINGSVHQIFDPWSVDLVYRMTNQMNASVRHQPILATPIINDNSINAFAVPGGVIAINTGTILASKTLDESASVLAHEVAHLSQRHYEHRNDQKGRLLAMQVGGFLAAIAAAAAGEGNAAVAMMAGSRSMAADLAAAHSREHEREADRVGMQILANNGYDARAMPRFFGRLHQQTTLNQYGNMFVPSFMRSHPFTSERLTEATLRANDYPLVSRLAMQEQAVVFDLLYWRLQYLSKQASFNELNAAKAHSHGAKMALVAWLSDQGRFNEARAELATLMALSAEQKQSLEPLLCITRAHVAYQQKDYEAALDVLMPCHRVYPERRDLKLYLADTLIYAGKPMEAQPILKSLTDAAPHDLKAWDLTQKAYQVLADTTADSSVKALSAIHALRARGLVELWSARYDQALVSLTQAKTLAEQHPNAKTLVLMMDRDIELVQSFKDFKL